MQVETGAMLYTQSLIAYLILFPSTIIWNLLKTKSIVYRTLRCLHGSSTRRTRVL